MQTFADVHVWSVIFVFLFLSLFCFFLWYSLFFIFSLLWSLHTIVYKEEKKARRAASLSLPPSPMSMRLYHHHHACLLLLLLLLLLLSSHLQVANADLQTESEALLRFFHNLPYWWWIMYIVHTLVQNKRYNWSLACSITIHWKTITPIQSNVRECQKFSKITSAYKDLWMYYVRVSEVF